MVNSEIVSYEFVNLSVRVEMVDGEPWFVAKDVCSALGLQNVSKSVSNLDEDERYNKKLDRGGSQILINESGLYSLILRSNKPEAKVFKRWVTKEVLPSIRKTGGYGRVEVSREDKLESMMNQFSAGFEAMSKSVSHLANRLVALESRQAQPLRQAQSPQLARVLQQGSLFDCKIGRVRISWSREEDEELFKLRDNGVPYAMIGEMMGRSYLSVRARIRVLRKCGYEI